MAFAEDGMTNFGSLLRDVWGLYTSHFHRNAREVGLTPLQCRLLDVLSRHEGISLARLAQMTDTDPMTVTRTLDSIRPATWFERLPDPDDGRVHRLYLRAAAVPILTRMWKIADQSRRQALSALSPLERKHLVDLLERVQDTLLGPEAKADSAYRYRSG
jgi:MarR family transcriptional regulator for hemolysin